MQFSALRAGRVHFYYSSSALKRKAPARHGATHLKPQLFRRQRQENCCKFKANLVDLASSRTAKATETLSQKKRKRKEEEGREEEGENMEQGRERTKRRREENVQY